MVSYTSGGSSKSESGSISDLPWRRKRGIAETATSRFVDPLLRGDFGAPGVQDIMNLSRGEASNQNAQLMAQIAGMKGLSQPARQGLMTDSMKKIAELAAGAGVASIKQLMDWYDRVMGGTLTQYARQDTSGGGGGAANVNPNWFKKSSTSTT